MKIVITGANGFVGAALCRYFYNSGHQVIAIGRQAQANNNLLACATYMPYDITKAIDDFDADVCIHAAALASDTAGYNDLYLNNVTGTRNVLEASKKCKHFIFISSSSVYYFTNKPAKETDANFDTTISNYGRTKLMAEELVKTNIPDHQQRLILRPRAIYGVGDRILLPRLLKLVKNHTIFYPADGKLQTSATYINNIAYAIELFLKQPDTPPVLVFNIADDEIYLLKTIALKMLNAVEGRELRVVNVPVSLIKLAALMRPAKISPLVLNAFTKNSMLDINLIKQSLGYKPLSNFDNSFAAIGQWVNNMGGKKAYLNRLNDAPWI